MPAEESADALLRRADALLDEMMLGGVDIGAGETPFEPVDSREEPDPATHVNGFVANGAHQRDLSEEAGAPRTVTPPESSYGDERRGMDQPAVPFTAKTAGEIRTDAVAASTELWRPLPESAPVYPSVEQSERRDARLVPAEERYARTTQPTTDAPPSGNGYERSGGGAVRRQSASMASTMTIGARANNRSTLLPRATDIDIDTAQQEINALMSEIAVALPVGHEAAERGRHLLNKALNILQSDPTRTAEVDYYLQQVRRIVERTRQTHTYSALYHRRLAIYLVAWIALAVTVLAARYLLQAELLQLLENLFWTSSDSIWVQFGPMTIGAIFAGAFGAATGVLINMQRHGALEYGYFDRKYGLRGLLLPILGAFFGFLLAAAWAAVCYFIGLDGANLWIGSAPAILAFALGFGQEWLYGAR